MSTSEIESLERKIRELMAELRALRRAHRGAEVPNYAFATLLFAGGVATIAFGVWPTQKT